MSGRVPLDSLGSPAAADPFEVAAGRTAGLYVHVPFCRAICPYCDFAVTRDRPGARSRFLGAVSEESAARPASVPFDSFFLGGGTPSALAAGELEPLLGELRSRYRPTPDCSVEMEVNPEDVDGASVATWRRAGVTRISLGVQALDDRLLKVLGRTHRREEALRAVRLCLEAGFDAVSLDLIYAVPGQELAGWRHTLRQAVALGIQHLSCYELTFHEGTPFERWRRSGRIAEVDEDGRAEWFLTTHRTLEELGMPGYEASNFAHDHRSESRHNRRYWRLEPYLGLGPSAHSDDGVRRRWNLRSLDRYLAAVARGASAVEGSETPTPSERALETLFLGLRTRRGVDLDRLRERTGHDPREASPRALERWLEGDRLVLEGSRLRPRLSGLVVAERIAVDLAPGSPPTGGR